MYNLGDFYDFDYSYLFDNSTDYDSMIPTWDYRAVFKLFVRHEGFSFLVPNTCIWWFHVNIDSDYDYNEDFSDDDWDLTDENYDLADWKPWGDYPESGEDSGSNTGTDSGSNTQTDKPGENKPGPGKVKIWRTQIIFLFQVV